MFKFSKRSLSVLSKVDERLQSVFLEAIEECPIDFGIPNSGGLRTAKEQNDLHYAGSSPNCDGYIKKSYHQTGNALDVYAYVNGKASWRVSDLTVISETVKKVAKRLGVDITWGGDWLSFVDMPHYQVKRKVKSKPANDYDFYIKEV